VQAVTNGDALIFMLEILLDYKRPDPTTWVYMSSFLIVGLFFVFRRFWSIRNLDIVLLILLAPGLLVVHKSLYQEFLRADLAVAEPELNQSAFDEPQPGESPVEPRDAVPSERHDDVLNGSADDLISLDATDPEVTADGESTSSEEMSLKTIQRWGFIYLLLVEGLILIRLLVDPLMVRRPLLDPNLTAGGLSLIGISLFFFMMANVVTSTPWVQATQGPALGPGYTMMNRLPAIPTRPVFASPGRAIPPQADELTESQTRRAQVAKALAIAAHIAIAAGMVLIASRHFGNLFAGVGCMTLYFILPYTAQMTCRSLFARGTIALGRAVLPHAADRRHVFGSGRRLTLLSAVLAAVVVWILLATRPTLVCGGCGRHAIAAHVGTVV